jgi:ribosomal protein S12 methylthiotransferase
LRTTVIVGFPGETEEDFAQLQEFIHQAAFDHLGAFMYSDAEDLAAHRLSDPVPAAVARKRLDRLMNGQKALSDRHMARHLDQVVEVLVESSPEPGVYLGRTAFQAPEVDGLTYVRVAPHALAPAIGRFARVRITDTLEYDLVGEPA